MNRTRRRLSPAWPKSRKQTLERNGEKKRGKLESRHHSHSHANDVRIIASRLLQILLFPIIQPLLDGGIFFEGNVLFLSVIASHVSVFLEAFLDAFVAD